MTDYRIQLKDKQGNRQFPVTTIQSVVDETGKSLDQILATLGSGDETIGGGGSIDPELLEGFIPLSREFSDDFNNDFSR